MYQPGITSQVNLQGQPKKVPSRNKQIEATHANDRSKKNPTVAVTKYYAKKNVKNFKQVSGGRRDKAFSKSENRIVNCGAKRYNQQNGGYDGNEPFALESLLNFQYTSARTVDMSDSRRNQFSRRKKNCFNKEEYLQARCNFVVTGSPDEYSINSVDPDRLVDWERIQLVYLLSHDPPNCPICLYSPIVAKMTRCGHIFCWSCILHYLHLGEKAWRKCPICHEAVHKNDLKSVKSYAQKKYSRLDAISMKLMQRSKESIFVSQVLSERTSIGKFSLWTGNSFDTGSKIMLATQEQIVEHILEKEKNELAAQLNLDVADEDGEEIFIKMALESVEDAIKSFGIKDRTPLAAAAKSIDVYGTESASPNLCDSVHDDPGNIWDAPFLDNETTPLGKTHQPAMEDALGETTLTTTDDWRNYGHSLLGNAEEPNLLENTYSASNNGSDFGGKSVDSSNSLDFCHNHTRNVDSYYFYQVGDGQNIFLHSLNARCLIEEYGSLEVCPPNITGQIVDFDCYTMTKELRKRFRYLSHLPLSSEFMICELKLKPPLLSKHTIQNFIPEFKKRKALRLKKLKIQQKFDREATAAGNAQHGFPVYNEGGEPEIDLSDMVDFPSNLSLEMHVVEEKNDACGSLTQEFHGLSFAQMLKAESTSPKKECAYSNVAHNSISGYESAARFISLEKHPLEEGEDGDGPDIVAPDFKQTFSAAMFSAPVKKEEGVNNSKVKGAKKRRDKGMLLFATGGQRKY